MTGGRIKRIGKYVQDDEFFCLTYGDGLSNIDITSLINFHKKHGKLATLSAVVPPGRFGALDISENNEVIVYGKPEGDAHKKWWILFVLLVIDYIENDMTIWEGP